MWWKYISIHSKYIEAFQYPPSLYALYIVHPLSQKRLSDPCLFSGFGSALGFNFELAQKRLYFDLSDEVQYCYIDSNNTGSLKNYISMINYKVRL